MFAIDPTAQLVALRHELHRHPEIGLRLPATQALVHETLTGLGLAPARGRDCSSVTAVVRGTAPGPAGRARPVVLLRADMDALPVQETAEVDYRSRVPGVMHACGHDLHTAALLGAAGLLVESSDRLPGDVILMFQPGEEGHDGARVMLGEGVLAAAGAEPSSAWALHVMSNVVPPAVVASRPGALMAASTRFTVTVRGAGGHAATPHLNRDPILAAADMVTGLYGLLPRTIPPLAPAVLSIGSFHGGESSNVVPAEAAFAGTLRAFDEATMRGLEERVRRYCEALAAAHALTAEVEVQPKYPVTVNDEEAIALARAVAGPAWQELAGPLATSEDFAHVLARVPGAMLLVGATPAGADWRTAPANHAPDAVFDDAVLPVAARLYAALAGRALEPRP